MGRTDPEAAIAELLPERQLVAPLAWSMISSAPARLPHLPQPFDCARQAGETSPNVPFGTPVPDRAPGRSLSRIDGAVIHKANINWTAGNCSRHPRAEAQWNATFHRCVNGSSIDIARRASHIVA